MRRTESDENGGASHLLYWYTFAAVRKKKINNENSELDRFRGVCFPIDKKRHLPNTAYVRIEQMTGARQPTMPTQKACFAGKPPRLNAHK